MNELNSKMNDFQKQIQPYLKYNTIQKPIDVSVKNIKRNKESTFSKIKDINYYYYSIPLIIFILFFIFKPSIVLKKVDEEDIENEENMQKSVSVVKLLFFTFLFSLIIIISVYQVKNKYF